MHVYSGIRYDLTSYNYFSNVAAHKFRILWRFCAFHIMDPSCAHIHNLFLLVLRPLKKHNSLQPSLTCNQRHVFLITEGLDPAERDAALTMCMISGGENGSPPVTSELLQAILHDHCYSKKPPNFVVPAMPRIRRRTG